MARPHTTTCNTGSLPPKLPRDGFIIQCQEAAPAPPRVASEGVETLPGPYNTTPRLEWQNVE